MTLDDDVMAVYKIYAKMLKEEFFSIVEDWHEPVQINLGPNVGDITIRCKPAKEAGLSP